MSPTEPPTGDKKAAGQSAHHEYRLTMCRGTTLSTLGEGDDLTRRDASQHSDSMGDEPITGSNGDGRFEAPTTALAKDENATAQDLPLVTSCEASSDPQHEAMDVQQPANADTSESPSDQLAGKEKVAMAHEAVNPRLGDRPGMHAGEVEEGTRLDPDPGSPPVMLPVVDEASRTETAQAKYELCAALLLHIFNTSTRQDQGACPASENGESIQNRDFSTGKTSVAATCKSDIPEDIPDVEMSEVQGVVDGRPTASNCTNQDSADETATVRHMEQTCGPSDQGNLAVGSQGMTLDDLWGIG